MSCRPDVAIEGAHGDDADSETSQFSLHSENAGNDSFFKRVALHMLVCDTTFDICTHPKDNGDARMIM